MAIGRGDNIWSIFDNAFNIEIMALTGNYLTIRLQQHSSGTTNEVVAETTSVDAQFTAEALETTNQADALVSNFVAGKNTIQVSGDFLLASDAEQFDLLFIHMNAGDKIEVGIYRSDDLVITEAEGVFTSLSLAGGLSDSLVTGAYSIEIDATMSPYGSSLNVSNCENGAADNDYDTFANETPTGFDAISDGSAIHVAGTADEIIMVTAKKYIVTFDVVLNSGTAPSYDLKVSLTGASRTDEGSQLATAGANSFTFTCSASVTCVLEFRNASTATNFEITNLSIREIL